MSDQGQLGHLLGENGLLGVRIDGHSLGYGQL